MKNCIKRFVAVFIFIGLILSLSGCVGTSAEDLYSLPQAAEEYVQLQALIDDIINSGAEYSAPTSGNHRQSVQLVDLNGDGVSEALGFFSFSTTDTKPLKIYIFTENDESYSVAAVVDGDGTAIDKIDYEDMDGDGILELIVGWQMSAELHMVSVYSIKDFQVTSLAVTDYTEYAVEDMNGDGCTDVLVVRSGVSGITMGEVEMYSLANDGEIVSSVASMSSGMESLSRVRTGTLSDGKMALFIDGYYDSTSIITDVFAEIDGTLVNISASENGVSSDTVRSYSIYTQDVDKDGIMDVPSPRELISQTDTTYWAIDWYSYSSNGERELEFSTFHNYSDGWYFVFPDDWDRNIAVRREDGVSGQRAVIFSYYVKKTGEYKDILAIYTMSGGESGGDERFTILEDDSGYLYEAEIFEYGEEIGITQNFMINSFHIIYNEWISGEI